MTANAVSKSAVSPDNRADEIWAVYLITRQTLLAMSASFGVPAQTDFIADLQLFGVFANRDNFADGFVSADKRIFGHPPFIIEH